MAAWQQSAVRAFFEVAELRRRNGPRKLARVASRERDSMSDVVGPEAYVEGEENASISSSTSRYYYPIKR